MKYIGIIAAMPEEVLAIKSLIKDISIKKVFNLEFIAGKINGKDVVLAESGEGKANAARTTQALIDNFDIEYIINVGTAGSLNDNIEIGDIVIAEKLVQHDYDISVRGFEKGEICNYGKYSYSDSKLIENTKNVMQNLNEDFNVFIGTIATGDIFVQDLNVKMKIKEEFNADCVEMEGAAIAQVCTLDKVPFIVIRGISDKPNGSNSIDFRKYLEMACRRYTKFIDIFLK